MFCHQKKKKNIHKVYHEDVPKIREHPYGMPEQQIIYSWYASSFLSRSALLAITEWTLISCKTILSFSLSSQATRLLFEICVFSLILWNRSLSCLMFTEHTELMSTEYFMRTQFLFPYKCFNETRCGFWSWCCESFSYMKSPFIKDNI